MNEAEVNGVGGSSQYRCLSRSDDHGLRRLVNIQKPFLGIQGIQVRSVLLH